MRRLLIGMMAALVVAACRNGGSSRSSSPPYDLRAAMTMFETEPSTSPVTLSGTTISGTTSVPFTGTGTITYRSTRGTFNGAAATLQTATIAGSITPQGASPSPYSSQVVTAYDNTTGAMLGASQSGEVDIASAPILIPMTVGTSPIILGTLSRYTDSTLSVALGNLEISVALVAGPIDPGTREVIRFTYRFYDANQILVNTETLSYYLTGDNVLTFDETTVTNRSGSLSVAWLQ